MLDDLEDGDPLWARVRAARPAAPAAFARSLDARLPVRRRPLSTIAVALAIVTAGAALVILIMGTGTRPDPVASSIPGGGRGSAPAAGIDARIADAAPQDAPSVDVEARARALVEALHAKDVKGAVAMLRVPLVYRGCDRKHAAATAEAARALASCLARMELFRLGQIKTVKRSTFAELIETARHADQRSRRAPIGTADLRALEADHDVIAVGVSTRREPYRGGGYEAATLYIAIDRAGAVGAIVLSPILIVD